MTAHDPLVGKFDYEFGGTRHRCGYRVVEGRLVVVVGRHENVADLDRMRPERLARIMAHELLVRASFARERCPRPD